MARGGGPLERIDYRLNWNKYCGFLDLDMAEFYAIQEALLGEQLAIIGGSLVAGQFLAGKHVASSAELRREVQLTSYKDYEPLLQQRDEAVLAEKLLFWSRTSRGRRNQMGAFYPAGIR